MVDGTTGVHRWLLALFALFSFWPAFSATPLQVMPFDTRNGLPQNTITTLQVDDNGLVWIGTQEGLVLSDGKQILSPDFLSEISGQHVLGIISVPARFIIVLTEHSLWTISQDYQRVERLDFHNQRLYDATYFLGKLWLATSEGLENFVYVPSHKRWQFHERVISDEVFVVRSTDDSLAAATIGKIWRVDSADANAPQQKQGIEVPELTQPIGAWRRGEQWCVSDIRQTYCDANHRVKIYPWAVHGTVSHRGQQLFATDRGLYAGELGTWRRIALQSSSGMPRGVLHVTRLLRDRTGGLWIGTFNHGLFYQNPALELWHKWLTSVADEQGITSTYDVTGIAPADRGWWLATRGAGLLHLDEQGNVLALDKLAVQLSFKHVEDVAWLSSVNQLWVATGGQGLFFYCDKAWHAVSEQVEHAPLWGFQLLSFGRNVLVAGIGGVWRFSVREDCQIAEYVRYRLPTHNLPSRRFSTVALDKTGQLWAGGESGVFYWPTLHSPRQGRWLSEQYKDLAQLDVHHIAIDFYGDVWLGTHRGLRRLVKRGTSWWVDRFDDIETLAKRNIYAVQPLSNGRLWLGSSQGVHLFDPTSRRIWRPKLPRTLGLLEVNPKAVLQTKERLLWGTTDGVLSQKLTRSDTGVDTIVLLSDGTKLWPAGTRVRAQGNRLRTIVVGAPRMVGHDIWFRLGQQAAPKIVNNYAIDMPPDSGTVKLSLSVTDPVFRKELFSGDWSIDVSSKQTSRFAFPWLYSIVLIFILILLILATNYWRRTQDRMRCTIERLRQGKSRAVQRYHQVQARHNRIKVQYQLLRERIRQFTAFVEAAGLLPDEDGHYGALYQEVFWPLRLVVATIDRKREEAAKLIQPVYQLLHIRITNRQELRQKGQADAYLSLSQKIINQVGVLRAGGWQEIRQQQDGEWLLFHESHDEVCLVSALSALEEFRVEEWANFSLPACQPLFSVVGVHVSDICHEPMSLQDARLLLTLISKLNSLGLTDVRRMTKCPMPLSSRCEGNLTSHLPLWLNNGTLVLTPVVSESMHDA